MRNLRCERLTADEIWGFIGKKSRHVKLGDPAEFGDVWTFICLDPQTKLIPDFTIGKRTRETRR